MSTLDSLIRVNAGSSTSGDASWRTRTSLRSGWATRHSSRAGTRQRTAGRQRFARSRHAYAGYARDLLRGGEALPPRSARSRATHSCTRSACESFVRPSATNRCRNRTKRDRLAVERRHRISQDEVALQVIAAAPTSAADPARGAFSPANIAPRETGPLLARALTSVVYQAPLVFRLGVDEQSG